ncbi:MAG: hypothetical protein ABI564_16180 [Ideonella sp.]
MIFLIVPYLFLAGLVIGWIVAVLLVFRGVQKSRLPRYLGLLLAGIVVLSLPTGLLVFPWYYDYRTASNIDLAKRGDEAAKSIFQSLCSQSGPIDLLLSRKLREPVDIRILEDDGNSGLRLSIFAREAGSKARSCNDASCLAANIANIDVRDPIPGDCQKGSSEVRCKPFFNQLDMSGNLTGIRASNASFALVIEEYQLASAEGSRIKRYPLKVVSLPDQKLLAKADLYRFDPYVERAGSQFCPPADQVFEELLAKVFPRSGN